MHTVLRALALMAAFVVCALPARAADVGVEVGLGSYYALLVGVQDYAEGSGIRDLESPENDVRALAAVLELRFGFEVRILTGAQASEDGILDALDELRASLGEEDSLLVYYAGHGVYDEDEQRGYWLPSDATAHSRARWIANDDLAARMRAVPARHVLLLADACFSGALFRDLGQAEDVGVPGDLSEAQRLARDRSRWVITSGGDEPVVDRYREGMSVFAYFLKAELERISERYVVPDSFFSGLREHVIDNARQTPRQGPFQGTGHEGGQLVMVNGEAGQDSGVTVGSKVDVATLAACARERGEQIRLLETQAREEWAEVEPLLSRKETASREVVQAWYDKWGPGRIHASACGESEIVEAPFALEAEHWLGSFTGVDETGFLVIHTDPPEAAIYLDGSEVGRGAIQLEKPVGAYVVEARLGAIFHPKKQDVQLGPDGVRVDLRLDPAYGKLVVQSTPVGAEVWLDGEQVGVTPWIDERMRSGSYELRVAKVHHKGKDTSVVVRDGRTTDVEFVLEATVGRLRVFSEPTGALISLDGEPTGARTPHLFEVVSQGITQVKLTLDGYGDVEENATVRSLEETAVELELVEMPGLLAVLATAADGTPCEGAVSVDGVPRGISPLKLELPSTDHRVSVSCGDEEGEVEVRVIHGERVSVLVKTRRTDRPEWIRLPGQGLEITRAEVTFGQYRACVMEGGCSTPHVSDGSCLTRRAGKWAKGAVGQEFLGEDRPVVCVDWGQASAYARWAGGRLPDKVEWIQAARGGQGFQYAGSASVHEVAWTSTNASGRTHDGCEKKPNGYDLCDMSGNVWEWTSTAETSRKVIAGGSWANSDGDSRVTRTYGSSADSRFANLGFRVVRQAGSVRSHQPRSSAVLVGERSDATYWGKVHVKAVDEEGSACEGTVSVGGQVWGTTPIVLELPAVRSHSVTVECPDGTGEGVASVGQGEVSQLTIGTSVHGSADGSQENRSPRKNPHRESSGSSWKDEYGVAGLEVWSMGTEDESHYPDSTSVVAVMVGVNFLRGLPRLGAEGGGGFTVGPKSGEVIGMLRAYGGVGLLLGPDQRWATYLDYRAWLAGNGDGLVRVLHGPRLGLQRRDSALVKAWSFFGSVDFGFRSYGNVFGPFQGAGIGLQLCVF